jgi:hypothetical protein
VLRCHVTTEETEDTGTTTDELRSFSERHHSEGVKRLTFDADAKQSGTCVVEVLAFFCEGYIN